MTTLGQRIKAIRESADMDRHTFASYIKIAGGAEIVEQWENDEKKPDENALERIAILGQTSPVTLACGKEINPYAIKWLFEFLEEQELVLNKKARPSAGQYDRWLAGQVNVLNLLRVWEMGVDKCTMEL